MIVPVNLQVPRLRLDRDERITRDSDRVVAARQARDYFRLSGGTKVAMKQEPQLPKSVL